MFLLLTQVLLWAIVGLLIWYILLRFIPRAYFTWLGVLLVFIFIVLAFFQPANRLVSDVWSILALPFKPLGLSILLLLSALRGGVKKVAGNQVAAALLILLLSSIPFVSYWLAQQAEQAVIQAEQSRREICLDFCPPDQIATDPPGAIAVLGRGSTQANLPYRTQIQLTDTGNRILYAAQLYQEQVSQGNAPVVIVSAGPRADLRGAQETVVEANDIATVLVNLGVPRERIVVEPTGVDIYTSATAVERELRERRLGNRVILVTSAIEARRAALTFSRLGIRVIARPTNFFTFQAGSTPARRIRVSDFVPSAEALLVTTRVVEEYLTSIYYFLRGWLSPPVFF